MTKKQIGELFNHYEKYLLTVILDRLYEGCPPDYAYDCLNDVFTIALEKKEDKKFNSNPFGWLKTTTHYVINNYNRQQRKRLRFQYATHGCDLNQLPSSDNWFEDMAYRLAIEENVWEKIMNDLKPTERVLLIMYYYQNMSLDDIAYKLNITKNVLKVRMNRMRTHVRKLIKKYVGA